ncbi:MAG: hypothetical protein GOV15_04065 [Candidatus Diapherotrites archaeon]|nr:hypothetical protein [Candidatus Diapherotrites archaeon]
MRILVFADRLLIKFDQGKYLPVVGASAKLNALRGCSFSYLTARTDRDEVSGVKRCLKYNFPKGPVSFRNHNENYAQVVRRVSPDVFITDDEDMLNQLKGSGVKVLVKQNVNDLPSDPRQL